MIRILSLGAGLLVLGACAAEFGAPDTSRGSADSPMTMLVDQTMNGVPRQGGTQAMAGRAAQTLSPSSVAGRTDFSGGPRPIILPQGGERR